MFPPFFGVSVLDHNEGKLSWHCDRTYSGRQLLVESGNVLDIHRTSAELGPIASTIGTRSDPGTPEAPRHHRSRDEMNDGLVGRYAAHKLSGSCLVATWFIYSSATQGSDKRGIV